MVFWRIYRLMNIDNFREFYLWKLFEINSGNSFDKSKMNISFFSTVNFIGRTNRNNGITAVVDEIEYVKPYEEGNITLALGGNIGSCFIQTKPFYTSQNVVVLIPLKERMSVEMKQFICTLIRNESLNNYMAFARELNAHIKKDFIIKLPIMVDNENTPVIDAEKKWSEEGYIPDWQFMENYIKSLNGDVNSIPDYFLNEGYNKACWYMDNIDYSKFEKEYAGVYAQKEIKLTDRVRKKFRIEELFEIFTGEDFILSDIEEGDIPVVSHTSENNGIANYSFEIENKKIFDCTKTISLADRGKFFATIQKNDFYIGTRVKALVFKNIVPSKYTMLFVVTILNYEKFRFSYGRNATNGLNKLIIELPIMVDNKNTPVIDAEKKWSEEGYIPDWQFMEDYIKSKKFSLKV